MGLLRQCWHWSQLVWRRDYTGYHMSIARAWRIARRHELARKLYL